jgi:FkbM family methyltransferase
VADVGAGDGFFTARLARAVGADGRVFAVDVAAGTLQRLRARVADEGLSNVQVIEGAADDPKLRPGSLDAALIVNAYHEMSEHQAMLTKIRTALKTGGRLVIVEPISASRRERPRDEQTRNHEIAVDFVRQEAKTAGFVQVALHDPFTNRPGRDHDHEEWLLVLAPAAPATETGGETASADIGTASRNDDWKSPDLRIGVAEFKRLAAAGKVLVLDVRDPQSYRQGHLPGAILMTLEELSTAQGVAKLKDEKRFIVTYCS